MSVRNFLLLGIFIAFGFSFRICLSSESEKKDVIAIVRIRLENHTNSKGATHYDVVLKKPDIDLQEIKDSGNQSIPLLLHEGEEVVPHTGEPGQDVPVHNIVRTEEEREEVHLGLALGFVAAVILVILVIVAVYHKRIMKSKRRHEKSAKLWTRETIASYRGTTSPDHVYQSLPNAAPVVPDRPMYRKPLETIYMENGKKPQLPPRSPGMKKDLEHSKPWISVADNKGIDEVESEYVAPNRPLIGSKCMNKISFMNTIKGFLGIRPGRGQPLSDTLLSRNVSTTRTIGRSHSFPVLANNIPASTLATADPTYISVTTTPDSKASSKRSTDHKSPNKGTPSKGKLLGKNPSVRKGPIPEINLLECDETCTFVKKL